MNFLTQWKWELSSPLAGILLTLSFAPFDYAYLALVSLVFVFGSWKGISPRRALFRGFLFGLGLFGLGVSWVYISIHDYGKAHFIGAGLLTAFFVSFWALFLALTAYLSVKLKCSDNVYTRALFISSVWILIEYFRGYLLLNGFPWLQVTYSQLDMPLSGYIPLVGAYGCGFLLLFSTALLAETMKNKSLWRQSALVLILVWGGGIYLKNIQWTVPVGDPVKVTLIQGNVSQDQKWLPQNRIKTMLSYQKMTEQHWDSDVIIWPETAIPAYLYQVEEFFINPLERKAQKNHTDLIVSLPAKGQGTKEYFNMALTLGEQRGVYKKNHLLPFGEYLPLQPLSGFILDLLKINLGNFTSGGEAQPLMVAGGYPFVTSICYEDAFASVFIHALPKAAYLVNVTNDAWFGDSIEPYQHMQIARMRALETGRYLLRATNTGVTAIVDFKGKIIKQAPSFTTTSITDEILPMGGMTPFARLGDKSIIMVLFLLAIILLFAEFKVQDRERSRSD